MTNRAKIVAVSLCCALVAAPQFDARADSLGTALYTGINGLRSPCGAIRDDARLTAAAQRHADDMLRSGLSGHTGSDGSSPQTRIAEAGYRTRATGEIVYWGTGTAANTNQALDSWMQSPPHRAIITNCAFGAGGFATASDGNKMTAVGDFAAP